MEEANVERPFSRPLALLRGSQEICKLKISSLPLPLSRQKLASFSTCGLQLARFASVCLSAIAGKVGASTFPEALASRLKAMYDTTLSQFLAASPAPVEQLEADCERPSRDAQRYRKPAYRNQHDFPM